MARSLRHRLDQGAERSAWGAAYVDNDRVFCEENGRDQSPDHVGRLFQQLVKQAGADIVAVPTLPGHSTTALTANSYSHLIRETGARAAEGLAAPLYGPDGAPSAHRAAILSWSG